MRIAKSGSGVEPADLEEKPTDRDPREREREESERARGRERK